MTRMEQLEKLEAELQEKQRLVKKKLAAQRRKARAQAEAEARAKERDDAIAFVNFCRSKRINIGGNEMTIYDTVMKMMEIDNPDED